MNGRPYVILVKVLEIKGHCPVYHVGSTFRVLDGFKLEADEPICMHSLASLLPYYVALSRGIRPIDLGLNKKDELLAYLQCLDPCEHTGGGTVVCGVFLEQANENP